MLLETLLVLPLLVAQPEAAAADQLPQDVRRLVRALDANDLGARVRAEQELIDLGPTALQHLPDETPRMSAEMRERLSRVRQKLLSRQVADAAQPSLVTFQKEGAPLAEVLVEIEKQTGNKLLDLRGRFGQEVEEVAVDVDFKNTRFWQAVDTVLEQGNLSVYPYAEGASVGIVRRRAPAAQSDSRPHYDGPFRIEATEVHALRNYREPASQSLNVTLEVAWEPRLTPIILEQPLEAVSAVDESGINVPVISPTGVMEAQTSPSSCATDLTIVFTLPERTTKKIASLKGTLRALLPGAIEQFKFEDLTSAKPVSQKKAAATVTVERTRKNGEIWEVHMRLGFDNAGGALDSHRGWMFNNKAFLLDPMGEQVEFAGFETTRHTQDEIGIAYFFDIPEPKGYTFVYETPAAILNMPIKYELKDLPLP